MTVGSVGNYSSIALTEKISGSAFPHPVGMERGNVKTHNTEQDKRPRVNEAEDTGEKPDFAAINLLKNSFPEPAPERRVQTYSIEDFINGESRHGSVERETHRQEQDVSQNATFHTSREIAEKDSGGGLTPAQERGYEAYLRNQNYQDPISVSNARAYIVA